MTLAAEYYVIPAGAKRANPGKTGTLQIVRIENGRRVPVASVLVESKTQARAVAAEHNATCWNF